MTHADNDTRDAFEQVVYDGDLLARYLASGKLWHCTDIMPSSLCDDLCLPSGSTYAAGAQLVRRGYHPGMTTRERVDLLPLETQRGLRTLIKIGFLDNYHRNESGEFVVTFTELTEKIIRSGGWSDIAAKVLDQVEAVNRLIRDSDEYPPPRPSP